MQKTRSFSGVLVIGCLIMATLVGRVSAETEWDMRVFKGWKHIPVDHPLILAIVQSPDPDVRITVSGRKTQMKSAHEISEKLARQVFALATPDSEILKYKKTTLNGVPAIRVEVSFKANGKKMIGIGYTLVYADDQYIVEGVFPDKWYGSKRETVQKILNTFTVSKAKGR